jgi:hypothetical protein
MSSKKFFLPVLLLFTTASHAERIQMTVPSWLGSEVPRAAIRGGPRATPEAAQNQAAQALPAAPAILNGNFTKQQYIEYIRNSFTGTPADCANRYNAFNTFFNHYSKTSGTISPRDGGPKSGRLDQVCNFLGYAHWCFALGFAYALREPDDYSRVNTGTRCYTYQEFCNAKNKVFDPIKVDDYISRIIDEVLVYNSEIRGTNKNTVTVTTEVKQRDGGVMRSSGYRVYDTDAWVNERISQTEMTMMLCK